MILGLYNDKCNLREEITLVIIELSKAELSVVAVLWQGYPAKASDIIKRLSDDTQWPEKPIKTLVSRLIKKQTVTLKNKAEGTSARPPLNVMIIPKKKAEALSNGCFKTVSRL